VSPPRAYAQRSLAAARRLWAPPPAVEEERGMAGGERGGRLRRMRRSRVWQALAARLWRRVGLDARSLRPLCRAFALDSLQQLQARAAPPSVPGGALTRARRAPAGLACCTAAAASVRGEACVRPELISLSCAAALPAGAAFADGRRPGACVARARGRCLARAGCCRWPWQRRTR